MRTNAGRIQVLSGFQVPLFGAKTLLGERVYYGWPVGLSNPAQTTDSGEVHTKSAFTLYLTVQFECSPSRSVNCRHVTNQSVQSYKRSLSKTVILRSGQDVQLGRIHHAMVPVLAISSGTMVASDIPKYYRTVNGRFSSFLQERKRLLSLFFHHSTNKTISRLLNGFFIDAFISIKQRWKVWWVRK